MGSKNKKTSVVPYVIDHPDATALFPLPDVREATGVHKKHHPDGCLAAKQKVDKAWTSLPGLDTAYPGLRVLHFDPPVLMVDDFFSAEECDSYAALREQGDDVVHELAQSATFSALSQNARTSTEE